MKTMSFVRVVLLVVAFAQCSIAQVFVPEGPAPTRAPDWPIRPPDWTPHLWAAVEVSSTSVSAKIEDQVARTKVEQILYNPNTQQVEGSFLFPVPRGAQLDKFTMEIDGKMVEAELLKSDKARGIYEEIVRKMKDPALLEYADRDLLKLRIFPIPANSQKRISFSYTQVLKSESGLISYTFPLNTTKYSTRPLKNVSVKVDLESKQPLKTIYSPTHKVEVKRKGDERATIGFETANARCDSDFELFFKSDSDEVGANLMTYKTGDDEGYFLMLLSPGSVVKKHKVVAKDVTFVLDTSGSMEGAKIKQAKKALEFCIENLNDQDRFQVIRFSTEVEPLFHGMREVNDKSRSEAEDFVQQLKATGSTALDAALEEALKARPKNSERPYMVIFLTDGLPTVGESNPDTIVSNVRKRSDGQTRIFCFGVGYDVNTRLLDRIAEETRAITQYVLPDEDIETKVSSFFAKINEPVLANPKLQFPDDARVTKVYPSPLLDLFKGEQIILAGRYSHATRGEVVLEGTVNGKTRKFRYDVDFASDSDKYDFIPRLWATRRVGYLLDEIRLHGEHAETKDEVTKLARKYGIVTPYTAYLIVEDEKKREVPATVRSLQSLDRDEAAFSQGGELYDRFKNETVGNGAIANSQYNMNFKDANVVSDAVTENLSLSTRQAEGTVLGIYAPKRNSAPMSAPATAPVQGNIVAQVNRSAQQTRFINGKNFFLNGNQWLDTEVQDAAKAKRVRVQFNSKEYFDLARTNKQVLPWLAQGNNVQFVLNGQVYEIYP